MTIDRRQFMQRLGAAGTTIGTVGLAGCQSTQGNKGNDSSGGSSGGDSSGGEDKNVEEGLPAERKAPELVHVTSPQDYWAERYESVSIIDKTLTEEIGLPVKTKGLPFSAWPGLYEDGSFSFLSSNWSSGDGDPDSTLVMTLSSEGANNHWRYSSEKYDEVALAQRRETDRKKRQDLVYEAQRILGEERPESQLIHNYRTHAFNNERIAADSVKTTFMGLRNIWNYISMEPKSERAKTIVTNNFDPTDSINPLHPNTVNAMRNNWAVKLTHDYLYRMDPSSDPAKWAATGHEWLDDTTLVVSLRDDLEAHNGDAVTAEDVVFTYNLILEKKPASYIAFVNEVIESVEQTGDLEVTFNLIEPYAPVFNATLGRVPILPKKHWESLMAETGNTDAPWNISFTNNDLVGSGAFELGEWEQGSRVEFIANKKHFNAPKIDKRIERTLASRQAESRALVQGEYDLLETWFGSPTQLRELTDKHDHLTMTKALADTRMAMWSNCEQAPLTDVSMRQAVNAVVRSVQPVIIEEVFDGIGEKARSPISPALEFWHNPDMPVFDGGVDAAIKILKDAGYAWDDNGNLYMPEGMTA